MRATGVVRRIDDLGRIVIPREIRRAMEIEDNAPLAISVDPKTGSIMLTPYKVDMVQKVKSLAEQIKEIADDHKLENIGNYLEKALLDAAEVMETLEIF